VALFVDASAVVAIINGEPDAEQLAEQLDGQGALFWSPVVQWETMTAVCRNFDPPSAAKSEVTDFGEAYDIKLVALDGAIARTAFDAFLRYGKRSGHAAKLNMGDCFAYACAKANNARLLYKGDDFAHTDLADA
jgi:ribonuclease VapC